MLKFRDFILKSAQYGDKTGVMKEINTWLQTQPVKLINVETVLLGSSPTSNGFSGTGRRYEVIRVWYEQD